MNYIDFYRKTFSNVDLSNYIIYGENINNGSFIGGLASCFQGINKTKLINVGNAEYTHIGMGFGIALDGGFALYISKQLDFLFFGMDHFISTIEIFKMNSSNGNFSIITAVQNQGFQGPQSSFNRSSAFSNLIRMPIYFLNSNNSIIKFADTFNKPGVNIGILSQFHFNKIMPITLFKCQLFDYYECYYNTTDSIDSKKISIYCNGFTINTILKYITEKNIQLNNILIVNHFCSNTDFYTLNREFEFNLILDDECDKDYYPIDCFRIVNTTNSTEMVAPNCYYQIAYNMLEDFFQLGN